VNLYALTYLDPAGRRWFIACSPECLPRDGSSASPVPGNLMRTDRPDLARRWKHRQDPGLWVVGLPPAVRGQLGGLDLYVVPMETTVGEPVSDRIPLSHEPEEARAPDVVREPRGRGKKAANGTPLFE
jgi:hypothetical protein